jgi:hypothetical protein
MNMKTYATSNMDVEKYRLRRFVERLIDMGEVEIHDEPVPLTGLSAIIERTERALLFKKAGPEQVEIIAKTPGFHCSSTRELRRNALSRQNKCASR